jgi:hypothetical protein
MTELWRFGAVELAGLIRKQRSRAGRWSTPIFAGSRR